MAANPFDRANLGYEGLFGVKTRFMHVEPAARVGGLGLAAKNGGLGLVEWIDVPVLDTRGAGWVERGTVGAVLAGFVGLCWVLFGGGRGRKIEGGGKKGGKESKKK